MITVVQWQYQYRMYDTEQRLAGRSGPVVCATVDRPGLDPAQDVDPNIGGDRYKRHPQPGWDEEEIDSLSKITLLRENYYFFIVLTVFGIQKQQSMKKVLRPFSASSSNIA